MRKTEKMGTRGKIRPEDVQGSLVKLAYLGRMDRSPTAGDRGHQICGHSFRTTLRHYSSGRVRRPSGA